MNSLTRALRIFFTGRLFLSLLCLAIAAYGAFVVLPQMYRDQEATTQVVRVRERVEAGEVIEARHIELVEVGAYNLPAAAILSDSDVLGLFAKVTLLPGDYIFADKIGSFRIDATIDAILAGNQKLVTITPKNAAQTLAAHLLPGDTVQVATISEMRLSGGEIMRVLDYPEQLSNLTVYSVENMRGVSLANLSDAASTLQLSSLQGSSNEDLVPRSITFIVTDAQAELLLSAEYNGGFHIIFRDRRP